MMSDLVVGLDLHQALPTGERFAACCEGNNRDMNDHERSRLVDVDTYIVETDRRIC